MGEKPISLTTLRSDSNAIAMFCAYASSSSYGWGAFCEQTFGDVPAQIAFDWNTPRHTTDDAMPPGRRAFTQKELQKLLVETGCRAARAGESPVVVGFEVHRRAAHLS